jgi:hypothetical protein
MRLKDNFIALDTGTVIEPVIGYVFAWDYLTEIKPKIALGESVVFRGQKYTIKVLVDKNTVVLADPTYTSVYKLALAKDLKGTQYIAKTMILAGRDTFKFVSAPLAVGQWRKRAGSSKVKVKALYEDRAVVGGPGWTDHTVAQEHLLKYDLIS